MTDEMTQRVENTQRHSRKRTLCRKNDVAPVAPWTLIDFKHTLYFNGTLEICPSVYVVDAFIECGTCVDKFKCNVCHKPAVYRTVAIQQPYDSVDIGTRALFSCLFPQLCGKNGTDEYFKLIMGYSSVLNHLRELCDPDFEFYGKTWTDEAKSKRTTAKALFEPAWIKHKIVDMSRAFSHEDDPMLGRTLVIDAYERVVLAGLAAIRSDSLVQYNQTLNQYDTMFLTQSITQFAPNVEFNKCRATAQSVFIECSPPLLD